MDKLQQVLGSFGKRPKSSESTNKKRKWREIEQIKERFQLEKELRAYEDSLEFMLEDFQLYFKMKKPSIYTGFFIA